MDERPWYKPDLNSQWFFVPGIIASLTLMTIVNPTSLAIVRKREIAQTRGKNRDRENPRLSG